MSYTTAQGLSSNDLQVITDDRDGRIYVGGAHGIDRLEPATGRIRHFTTADGLQPGSFLAAYRDVNGTLWFGMSNGLARLVPSYDGPRTATRADQRTECPGRSTSRVGAR